MCGFVLDSDLMIEVCLILSPPFHWKWDQCIVLKNHIISWDILEEIK